MHNTILFDLDGTLLPFEQNDFIKLYFQLLCQKLAPLGYAPQAVVDAVWRGTAAMVKNDGSRLNHDCFWDTFASLLGEQARDTEGLLDEFYTLEFDQVKAVLKGVSPAAEMVRGLKKKGYTVVLATNPLFPAVALHTRMRWVGLQPQDFDYITHYQNSTYCKPDVRYYREILQAIGKTPAECLMLGNNVAEDMVAGETGMAVYLVTDYTENPQNRDINAYPHGMLAEASAMLAALLPL